MRGIVSIASGVASLPFVREGLDRGYLPSVKFDAHSGVLSDALTNAAGNTVAYSLAVGAIVYGLAYGLCKLAGSWKRHGLENKV